MNLTPDNCLLEPFTETCLCGRSFAQPFAFSNHQRTCQRSKKRISNALAKAKEIWTERKRRRLNVPPQSEPLLAEPQGVTASFEPREEAISLVERRPRRVRVLPKRFRDVLPEPSPALPPAQPLSFPPHLSTSSPTHTSSRAEGSMHSSGSDLPTMRSRIRHIFRTPKNVFGLLRQYCTEKLPSHDPEEFLTLSDMSFTHTSPLLSCVVSGSSSTPPEASPSFYPYPNESSFRLGNWYWNGGVQKSQESFRQLLNIVGDLNFHPGDVRNTKWDHIDSSLASDKLDGEEWMDEDAGWHKKPITISVPFHRRTEDPGARDYVVADFYYRSLVAVIREKLGNAQDNQHFHYEPYEMRWQTGNRQNDERVHGELYTSPAFLEAHHDLQDSPGEPGCDLPRVVVGLMFSSDVTHLTSFGNAKLWPLYLYFGNESKYRRFKPSYNLCNHVAYFQKLPDAFKDFATKHIGGKGPNRVFMAHCRRELMHAQWRILLDDEFLEAYEHGIVITCCDGIARRFYPRIFIYSADYPEKIIIASIRNQGDCPCPRCLIPKSRVQNVGMALDRKQRVTLARDDARQASLVDSARKCIYEKNYGVDSTVVEKLLKGHSLVATSNAFSDKLAALGFRSSSMMVVDLMHEFELGVWKALFIHLLRILQTVDPGLIHEVDRRQMPTFGRDTIRRFSNNVSEMKQLAARDFEDLLQCAIPVFEGLLPEPHNRQILEILFVMAHWHGLAKLRMHTDTTLTIMDQATTTLGKQLRVFEQKTCAAFKTQELPREMNARKRRQANTKTKSSKQTQANPSKDTGRRSKVFNLHTYKVHALGDYVETIRKYGTTDSYTTEAVSHDRNHDVTHPADKDLGCFFKGELEHRTPKARYTRTSRKLFIRQLTRIERRQVRLRRIAEKHGEPRVLHDDDVANTPDAHHHIGKSQKVSEDIGIFLRKHSDDPAVKIVGCCSLLQNFVPKLKEHLLPRIKTMILRETEHSTQRAPHSEPTASQMGLQSSQTKTAPGTHVDHNSIFFKNDRIYMHKILRINYTTYDVRRAQDVVNPSTSHCNIMVIANHQGSNISDPGDPKAPSTHQFMYARVLGVSHVNVIYTGPGMLDYRPRRMEFLWVRWFEHINDSPADWDSCQLDHLRFLPMASEEAFGFIDPADVLRSCHIAPMFANGQLHSDGTGLSKCAHDNRDWHTYYMNRFVDRDMIMRFHWGLAVGHVYTHDHNGKPDLVIPLTNDHEPEETADLDGDRSINVEPETPANGIKPYDSDLDNQELCLDSEDSDGENDEWDMYLDSEKDGKDSELEESDNEFLAFHEMYDWHPNSDLQDY